jgi:hypothetical protein
MTDDLKLPQVGELTLPRWQYWLARYNEVLGERERRIEKLESALAHIYAWYPISVAGPLQTIHEIRDFARKALEGKDD